MVVLTKLPLMVLRNDKMDDEQQRIILITDWRTKIFFPLYIESEINNIN